jgi:hypothetical protein
VATIPLVELCQKSPLCEAPQDARTCSSSWLLVAHACMEREARNWGCILVVFFREGVLLSAGGIVIEQRTVLARLEEYIVHWGS